MKEERHHVIEIAKHMQQPKVVQEVVQILYH